MQDKIQAFKDHVKQVSSDPSFVHYKWFVQWHLEIVERIATELAAFYPEADKDLVVVMAWLHDYGKALDPDNEYQVTLAEGRKKLTELGFAPEFVDQAVKGIEMLNKKLELDLHQAAIEVQIVSSADGCSHMAGPFMHLFWNEATDKTFAGKDFKELMPMNIKKISKDWDRKITLPEARRAFQQRHDLLLEQSGELPDKFL